MAKNRPLVTLKQSGVLNTVRTKCQHRRLRTVKKTCEVIVCIFRPIIKLYYYFEFTSLHSPSPSIFLEKVFFVNSSIRIIILHTYILRLLNIYIYIYIYTSSWCIVTFRIFEVRFKKWLEFFCFLILPLH